MSRAMYGIETTPPPCVYTIPDGQNVQIYIQQVNNILEQFKAGTNKNQALENLQTLNALMTAVRNRALGVTTPGTTG